jgi:hypothetical protein
VCGDGAGGGERVRVVELSDGQAAPDIRRSCAAIRTSRGYH